MLDAVKRSMGITSRDPIIEQEISDLIEAALYDLHTNGVNVTDTQDSPPIIQAVKTYCRAHFHSPADYDKLLSAYEEQKGHLMNCTGYTNFGAGDKHDKGRHCDPLRGDSTGAWGIRRACAHTPDCILRGEECEPDGDVSGAGDGLEP